MEFTRLTNPAMTELGFDSLGSRRPAPVDTASQVTQTQSAFPDVSINDEKIEGVALSKVATSVFSAVEPNTPNSNFDDFGLMQFQAPTRLMTYDYQGTTSGGPQDAAGRPYDQEGMMYARINYGFNFEDNIMVYIGGAWRTVTTS